ncbi:MAG: hypothetical protein E7252_05625 [Lachnospira sp.]|nr:hypothetical protein [Lachnospira sp.]
MANIMNQGINGLVDLKNQLIAFENQKEKLSNVSSEVKKLQKELNSAEKEMQNNIDSSMKKRRAEIAGAYDPEINKQQDKLKKAKAQRNKAKNKGVKERISVETAELRAENKNLNDDIKDIVRSHCMPKYCSTPLYFNLFMPKGIGEYFKLFLIIVVFAVGLPGLVYLLLPEDVHNTVVLVIVYSVIIIVEFLLHRTISNKTEIPYNVQLRQAREIRNAIIKNNKQIKKIKKSIKRDKDDEQYGLTDYDEVIAECEKIIETQTRKRDEALNYFETNTKPGEVKKITDKAMVGIERIKADLIKKTSEEKELERNVNATQSGLITNYELQLGKDMMNSDKIADLIAIMKNQKISTVSEALAIYKKK